MVGELVDILRLCQATDDPAPALARVCETVRARLGARDVAVWNEVEASLREYESAGGFEVPGESLVGAATK